MDKAFGFQTVDLRSNPSRILLTYFFFFCLFFVVVVVFFFFCFCFFFYLVFIYLYVLPFVFFLGYFFIKHGILFTKFARVEFECMFSFVSLMFIS